MQSAMNTTNSKSDLQARIARDLLHLLADGEIGQGDHLRELDLCDRFGVSRSPVRAALNFLQDLGALQKQANKGFFVAVDGTRSRELIGQIPEDDDEKIKAQIARDWFNGDVASEVSEGEIRTRYKLGKIAASRVLTALAEDGVVSRMPGYGWKFEPTLNTASAHDESYDFRMIVEPASILSAQFRFDHQKAASLRRRHRQVLHFRNKPDLAEVIRLDEDFHDFIARCSGNRFVEQALAQQNRLRRLMEFQSLIDAGRLTASCLEHMEILDHLEAGNRNKAAEAMLQHLQRAKESRPDFS